MFDKSNSLGPLCRRRARQRPKIHRSRRSGARRGLIPARGIRSVGAVSTKLVLPSRRLAPCAKGPQRWPRSLTSPALAMHENKNLGKAFPCERQMGCQEKTVLSIINEADWAARTRYARINRSVHLNGPSSLHSLQHPIIPFLKAPPPINMEPDKESQEIIFLFSRDRVPNVRFHVLSGRVTLQSCCG